MALPSDDPRNASRVLVELSGTVLEQRYELGRVLGAGGMGAVFEGRHLRLDRPVAIKVLRPGFAEHDEYVARFLREAKAASKIRHRNVVEILDYGEASAGLVYSVMELLVGQDLEQLLRAQPDERLPWARACDLLVQITSGLKAAHGQGVIHRDIKPANCFLTDEDGEPVVKLVDFGIAKLEEGDQAHQLTATAQVLGTPSYIAPEVARTKSPASPSSDIYALGVLAYRMLAGRVPFTADTVFELLRRACFDPVPPLRALVPDLPPGVEELVLELLAKEPEDRPPDMLTVRQRLRALGRETLGAEALEIPSFSALPLDAEISGPARSGASMRLTRDVVLGAGAGDTALAELPVVGVTAVELEPVPGESERPPRVSEAPTAVLVASAEAPRQMVHERPSSPSSADATTPVVDEATRRLGETASIDRSRGGGPRWIVLGVAAVLTMIVGLAVFVLGDDGNEAAVEGNGVGAAELGAELTAVVPVEPDEEIAPTAEVAPKPNEVLKPRHEPRVATSTGETEGAGSAGSKADPGPLARPEPAPEIDPRIAESPAPADQPKKERRPAKTSEPPAPPSDASLIIELKRSIKKNCERALNGAKVTVSFVVDPSGEVLELTSKPSNAAGDCATLQVAGTNFRPRFENDDKSISVP